MGVGVLRSVVESEIPDLSNLKCGSFVQLAIRFWYGHKEEYTEWFLVRVDLMEEDSMLGTIFENLFLTCLPGGSEFKYGSYILFEKHNIFSIIQDNDFL